MSDEIVDAAAAQLINEASLRAEALGAVLGVDLALTAGDRIRSGARQAVETLRGDDDRCTADAAGDILALVFPDSAPSTAWFGTPLGQLVAGCGAAGERVSLSIAASTLGVSRQAVSGRLGRGRTLLERHPDGGVTAASLRRELDRDQTPAG